MSRGPRFSLFRPWIDPSSSDKTNGDGSHSLSLSDEDERRRSITLAVFFTVVALLFVLAEYLGRVQKQTAADLAPDSTAFVSLTLLSLEKSGGGGDFSVRFRLSNRGNHSVFYPINTTTNALAGQLVVRASPSVDWTSLPNPSHERVATVQNSRDSNLAWIEMPPGGWFDSKFTDTEKSPAEHAYVIYVRPTRDSNGIRIVSNSYNALLN